MKDKFNPKDVPSWCKWIAVDDDGEVRCFRIKPFRNKYINMWNVASSFERSKYLYKDKKPKNWKDELYTWGY